MLNAPNPHKVIGSAKVKELTGQSDMTIWRKLNDPESDFPRPKYVGRKRFWKEVEIIEWLNNLPSEAA